MLFKNIKPQKNKDDYDQDDDDLYQDDFNILNPFEFEPDDRPELLREMDRGGSIIAGIAKLAVWIMILFFLFAMLPGVYKFILLFAREFYNWVDKLF